MQVMDSGVVRDATPEEITEIEMRQSAAPTEAQIVAAYMASVQQHLDAVAVAAGYDGIVSVVTYADEPAVPRYQAEGVAFRAWRSQVWLKCEQVLAGVKAGTRAAPTTAELIEELPAAPGIED